MSNLVIEKRGKGRPPKVTSEQVSTFDPSSIQVIRGSELSFDDSIFEPISSGTFMDIILSEQGGLMPATSMVICGGPGSGKSTVVLDMLSKMAEDGKKVLFISGEMDEIGHYKYCRRMHRFANVPTLFLKNYSADVKETLEHVFEEGWDVVGIDSVAEVIDMYKDTYSTTESKAELWFLNLQGIHKKGGNEAGLNTAFINIQQVTKSGGFAGSNRLKHMTDAMCHVDRIKDSDERKVYFSKNRDCNIDTHIKFRIGMNQVEYMLPEADEVED
jgi:DNA repair protein RadA/Sms